MRLDCPPFYPRSICSKWQLCTQNRFSKEAESDVRFDGWAFWFVFSYVDCSLLIRDRFTLVKWGPLVKYISQSGSYF